MTNSAPFLAANPRIVVDFGAWATALEKPSWRHESSSATSILNFSCPGAPYRLHARSHGAKKHLPPTLGAAVVLCQQQS